MAKTGEPFKTGFMADDDRRTLRETFLNQPAEVHTSKWDELWQKSCTPWDRGGPSIALKDAVIKHPDIFGSPLETESKNRKRALIPGCGRGWDVLLLASLGYDTTGLDASETAIKAAQQLQTDPAKDAIYAPQNPDVGAGKVQFLLNDFFKDDFLRDTNGANFDLIFDYTFLCALPPELRSPWAQRMSTLLSRTGRLVCLEWPLGKDPQEGGPPFGLTSDLYQELFQRPRDQVEYDERGIVVRSTDAEKNDDALVRVAHYQPVKTHEAGAGKDFISIWKHASA